MKFPKFLRPIRAETQSHKYLICPKNNAIIIDKTYNVSRRNLFKYLKKNYSKSHSKFLNLQDF